MRPSRLSPSVCVAGQWPHNERTRHEHGFACDSCGEWVSDTDERWFFTNKFGNRQERLDLHYRPAELWTEQDQALHELAELVVEAWMRPKIKRQPKLP